VLTHGAGGNCRSPLLVAVAKAFAQAGLAVLRCDLPFRQQRPSGPPHPSKAAADRAGILTAIQALREVCAGDIYLGGHSYGGRQASMLAAEDPAIAPALLLLSYPLHPPAKPEQLRTAHFAALRTRTVFVHGVTDPFGTIEEMQSALQAIPAGTTLLTIPKAGHDLRHGRFDLAPVVAALLG
jgi:predicted alpha/beta-hydrolase family hydrolase